MPQSVIQPSFAGGELSPSLGARVDIAKYHVGAARLRNMLVDYRGGALNRPGTRFIARCKPNSSGQPRLLPFEVSTLATYVCEFGDAYVRFFSNGAPIFEAGTTISGATQANPIVVTDTGHGYSNGDEIQISGVVGMIQLNGNSYLIANKTANTYQLTDLSGNLINSTGFGAYVSGGLAQRVYTLASPYAVADLPLVKYVQSANVLTLTHPNYPVYNLSRLTSTSFSLVQDVIGPVTNAPSALTAHHRGLKNSDAVAIYVVTAVSQDGKEESLPCFPITVICDLVPDVAANDVPQIALSWSAPSTPPSTYNIYKGGPTRIGNTKGAPVAAVLGYIGQSVGETFTDTYITPDFSHTPPQFQDPFSPGQLSLVKVNSPGSGYTVGTSGDLATGYITALSFSGGSGSGAAGYAIIDPVLGQVAGVVITNFGKGYLTAPTVTDVSGNATYTATVGQLTGTYPATPTYFQQRRVFAGTANFPESLVASQPGVYDNFDTSAISAASDALTISLAGQQDNTIKSMIPMSTGLVIFTTGGGFLLNGGSQGSAVTPSTATALPQASSGANDLPPLRINYDILYGQNRGATVRDLAFNFYVQSYSGTDRSVLASHLFLGFTLLEWSYAEEPFRLIHVVRDDGEMLVFTYVPEQEVYAWTHYDTNGLFKSVISIPEGQENAVYVIAQRYINGDGPSGTGSWVYYIERFASRIGCCIYDGWYVDCALQLPQASPNFQLTASAGTGSITLTSA